MSRTSLRLFDKIGQPSSSSIAVTSSVTLEQKRIYKPVCKNYFSNRVVKLWNKLPEHVIRSESLNTYKNRLDKLWYNQDLLTDYRSSIDPKKYPQITISNTRATFAYYSFCDNLRLQCTLRLLSLFAVIFKLISSEKK